MRTMGNPERIFCDGVQLFELENKPYNEIVKAFQKRIVAWYFETLDPIKKDTRSYPKILRRTIRAQAK